MRAMSPVSDGYVERSGVKIHYEVFGTGAPTILLLPTWSIVPSRHWKMQVPYLARHHRVVTFDGRGCGLSDRPADDDAYADTEFAADAVAVLDATDTDAAVLVGLSMGAGFALRIATIYPERVLGAVFIAPAVPLGDGFPDRKSYSWNDELDNDEGWARYNRHYWLKNWRGFAEFFATQLFSEPHSTKGREDAVGWMLSETDPETIVRTQRGKYLGSADEVRQRAAQVHCPSMVVHGTDDRIIPLSAGRDLAAALGCEFVELEGCGHKPDSRDPVRVSLLIREFVQRLRPEQAPQRRWVRAQSRPRRALYLSSPIGLGHARRDLAIARELRLLHPDLQIDWLTQHPVTAMLDRAGENVHPASTSLVSESGHLEDECGEHDLHVFQAFRRMDEILCANFGVLHDLLAEADYDLVVGDEAWDADYYLHENPELKRTAFAWMTDFVGWVPMAQGGVDEAALTSDYNAEMLEQIARYPRVRDRSVFVGDPADVVDLDFGPGLPSIRSWTEQHYDFAGYIGGIELIADEDRAGIRAELGYRPDERVCVVSVGGTGVGSALLRRVIAAAGELHRDVPDLRLLLVAGPRIDPDSLPAADGVEVRGFVPDLWRHLAACDIAIVQGGLTTTMELVANRRPFVYVPLRNHFEQQVHVRHRLNRYRAGRCVEFDDLRPDVLAAAIAEELTAPVRSLPVTDGAGRAAALLADLL
jgi:pimeloyl-ACP methyl ester carboxylesterase/predicted glycosyltransferase